MKSYKIEKDQSENFNIMKFKFCFMKFLAVITIYMKSKGEQTPLSLPLQFY